MRKDTYWYANGYVIFIDRMLHEKWAFKCRPELYPYDYLWFSLIEPSERFKYGVPLELPFPFTTV